MARHGTLLALAAVLAPAAVRASLAPGAPTAASAAAAAQPWPPIDYNADPSTWPSDIVSMTNGGCDFMEDYPWEETFSSSTLNTTRWLPDSMSGQDHCVGLPPAGPTTCTQMLPSQVQVNTPLPGYPGGANGLVLALSQTPCVGPTNTNCCNNNNICANWAGAHLVSAGCVQFGVLEIEAAFNMPINGGGFFFLATYIVKGSIDPAWNEVDLGFINGPRGLEFHATVFTAPSTGSGTATTMDALIYDSTGPVQTMGGSPKATDGSAQNGKTNPNAKFSTPFGSAYHTFKIVWSPTWKAWMVDTVVYRNITFTTWRPQSIRNILRTNIGTDGDVTQLPDSFVYVRRIRYTPWSWQAAADAIRCTSMAACYGPMPQAIAPATALGALSISPGGPPGGRRKLLSTLSDNAQRAQLAQTVANTIPGLTLDSINVSVTGYAVSGVIAIEDPNGILDITCFTPDMQAAVQTGLAIDFTPTAEHVQITGVQDISAYTGDLSASPYQGAHGGVVVSFIVDGFAVESAAASDLTRLNSASALQSCRDRLSAAETHYNWTAILQASGADPQLLSANAIGFSVLGATPAVTLLTSDAFATMSVTISTNADDQALIETAFTNAVHSGAFGRALDSNLGLTVMAPTATQAMALVRANSACMAFASEVQADNTKLSQWRAVGIAFVIITGTTILNFIAFGVYHARCMARVQTVDGLPPASYVADVMHALARLPRSSNANAAAAAVQKQLDSEAGSPTRAQQLKEAYA